MSGLAKKLLFTALPLVMLTEARARDDTCAYLDGGIVLNSDNEFIGTINNKFSSDSIFNSFGTYGNEFSSESIWNKFGKNGNEFASNSAFNQFTSDPPRIIKDREVVARLTANKYLSGAVHPTELGVVCYDFKPPR